MKKTFLKLALALSLGLGVGLPAAQAGVITFDPPDEFGVALADGDQTSAQGFNLRLSSGLPGLSFFIAGLDGAGSYASNGSFSLYAANAANIVLSNGQGAPFNFSSFEFGGGNLAFLDPAQAGNVEPWATQLDVLGITANNQQLMTSLLIDPLFGGLTVATLNWSNLAEVQFRVSAGDFSLDNLSLQTVPEPGSWALVALALVGLAMARRQSKSLKEA